jgi:hypothetical protein
MGWCKPTGNRSRGRLLRPAADQGRAELVAQMNKEIPLHSREDTMWWAVLQVSFDPYLRQSLWSSEAKDSQAR